MPFPETNRVVYKKNPLVQVICQFRFHPILRIDDKQPVDFQEKIRKYYPVFRDKASENLPFPEAVIDQLPPEMLSLFNVGNRAFEFANLDNEWVISLTKDFFALTTSDYVRWEEFKSKLEYSFNTFVDLYSPAPFTRIGLRYRNIIKRSELNLETVEWTELLQDYLVADLKTLQKVGQITELGHVLTLHLDDNLTKVRIRHGLVKNNDKKEDYYLIDNDFFTDQITEVKNGIVTLDRFNRENHRLFRWCITDRLHQSMEPTEL